ncbi:hypothetical protein KTD33_30640 [Burkholderia gladioli]|uniref:hypothetical protein n=1 Tax=Burkholderia gladioli TaxID=28095 RepID=UPI001C249679|nr:hypothetical protein [Burkholderia gladioli]MBU9198886.1 hypothetical protein [Burkholderia gladioli]
MDGRKLCQHASAVEPRAAFELKDFVAGLWALVEQARGWEKAHASSAVLSEDIDSHKASVERELHHLVGSYRRRLASETSLLKQLSACSNALDAARASQTAAPVDGGSVPKSNENEVSATAEARSVQTFSGELVKVGSSPVMGGSLTIAGDGAKVTVEGLPEAAVRSCGRLLFTRVTLTIGPEADWIPADRAAFESGMPLEVVRGWAQAGYVACRTDNGGLMVEAASLRAYAHRHWKEASTPRAVDSDPPQGPAEQRDGDAS